MRTDMRTRLRTDPLSGNYRDVALCRLLKAFEGLCRLLRLTGWLVTITNSLLHQHHLQPLLHPAASQSKYVHLLAPHTQPLGLRRVLHRPYGQSSACILWSLLKKFTPSLPPVVDCSLTHSVDVTTPRHRARHQHPSRTRNRARDNKS